MAIRILLIVLLAASVAPAQRGGGSRRTGGGEGMNIPVGPMVKNHLEQMTDALDLSKDQKKQVKTLMDAAQKDAAPFREQLVKGRAQIAAAIQAGKQDEVDSAIKAQSQLESQMAEVEMRAFAGIYKLLDDGQKQKSRAVFVMMPGIFAQKNWVDVTQ